MKIAALIGVFTLFVPILSGQLSALETQSWRGRRIQSSAACERSYLIADTGNAAGGGHINFTVDREGEAQQKRLDPWMGKDKYKHFLLSGFWSGFGYLLCHRHFEYSQRKSLLYSGGIVLSLGVVKEIRDGLKSDNRFSYRDLIFDLLGVSCGLFLASR